MQKRHADASWRFKSLDDVYYTHGQTKHLVQALYDHEPKNGEIELKKGDLIHLAGNHWDGYSNFLLFFMMAILIILFYFYFVLKKGLFPSYKIKEVLKSF